MNTFANIQNSPGILKKAYPGKGPVSQMNDAHPMIHALRKKRDALKTG